jgi:type I restriction enzyme S subunit
MENIPKNWVVTELDSLFSLAYGKGLSVKELLPEGKYNVYGANSIIGNYNSFNQEKSKVIISCRGAASGAIHQTLPKSFVTSNSIVLDAYSDELLLPNYVKYFMTSADKSQVITGTAQPQITIQLLKNLNFCFPPLAEQQRIVAKLDALFGHLDTLKTRLNNIPQILKNFRQAVLNQAVTGKLTEEWREGKDFGEWREDILGNIILGTPKNGAYYHRSLYGSGTRIIRIDCFYDGALKNWDVVQYVEIPESDKAIYGLDINDILINRVNSIEYLGKCMLVDSLPEDCIYESNMMRITCNSEIITPKYLKTYLISHNGLKELRKNAKHSVNQASINQQDVKSVIVSFPPKEEQTEIVKRVEHLFAKAAAIETAYQNLKQQIDALPQAILAKAFKGELVEQLPTDGDAKDLLKEIVALRALLEKEKKSKKKKKVNA